MPKWKFEEIKIQDCKEFVVRSGVIGCKGSDDYFYLDRVEEENHRFNITPCEKDAMTHYLVDVLNERKDFKKYYKKYMGGK